MNDHAFEGEAQITLDLAKQGYEILDSISPQCLSGPEAGPRRGTGALQALSLPSQVRHLDVRSIGDPPQRRVLASVALPALPPQAWSVTEAAVLSASLSDTGVSINHPIWPA